VQTGVELAILMGVRTDDPQSVAEARRGSFATTHWSVVLAATDPASPEAAAAIEELCATYWFPLYAYVRHRGYGPEDAQDLTQEFFYRLLNRNYLAAVDPRKGKFRSFLIAAMNHFLAKEWERARTLKRGGRVAFLSWDGAQAEERYQDEQTAGRSPEQLYERAWVLALLEKVLGRLRREALASGQSARFEDLKGVLVGERSALSYAELAAKLNTTESAVKMSVHRLRGRYAELMREEIAQTVAAPEDIEDELRHLRQVLSSAA
jgi:RNA polymerase sigma factor (sigma-70 family)